MSTVTLEASLVNPTDSTEVNVVAAVAAVGNTHRLVSGQIIKWTPEFLREHASDFIAKPVNILLQPDPKSRKLKASKHSRFVVGAIKESRYDEAKQAIMVTAALWEHYDPKVVAEMRKLYAEGDLHVSMELKYPKDTLQANSDGSYTPTVGTFSGMGFVGQAGDPRSMVYLMAELAKEEERENPVNEVLKELAARILGTHQDPDEEEEFDAQAQDDINAELSAAHEGSFEWLARSLQEHLSAGKDPNSPAPYSYVIATYPNYAIYQEGADYFRIDYKRSGDKVNFGEPQEVDPVYQPTASASAEEGGVDPADNTGTLNLGEEQRMSEKTQEDLQAAEAQNAELKASLDAMSGELAQLTAALKARDEADANRAAQEAATAKANERMAELEKIVPVKDELKAGLLDNLKVIDDAAYEALKASFATSAELRAGIAPGNGITNPEADKPKGSQSVSEADKKLYAEEAAAQFGTGPKSGSGE